jgi:hypothetical protein
MPELTMADSPRNYAGVRSIRRRLAASAIAVADQIRHPEAEAISPNDQADSESAGGDRADAVAIGATDQSTTTGAKVIARGDRPRRGGARQSRERLFYFPAVR